MAKRNVKRVVTNAVAHIKATFNNTIISITDPMGNVLVWASAGMADFKGARKSTPFAATKAAEIVAEKAKEFGIRSMDAWLSGPGPGRDPALKRLKEAGHWYDTEM